MPSNPFAPYNPFLMPSRSTRGNQIALPQYFIGGTTFSTTNITDALYAFNMNILTKGRVRTDLIVDGNISLIHSAPPASVDVRVYLDYGNATGTGYYIVSIPSVYIASATLYTNVHVSTMINLDSYGMAPGVHTVGVVVKLNTAGTLTMLDSSGGFNGLVNILDTTEVGYVAP